MPAIMQYLEGLSSLTSWLSPGDSAAPATGEAAAGPTYGPTSSANGSLASGAAPFLGQYDAPVGDPLRPEFTPEYTDRKHDYGYDGKLKFNNPVLDQIGKLVPGFSGPNINFGGGRYQDDDGKDSIGFHADAETVKYKNDHLYQNDRGKIGLDLAGPGANAKWQANENTSEAGASARGGSIAVTAQTTGTDHDEAARLGYSHGAGAAARFHYGDTDGDGRREYGFGLDVGPVTFDVKTEDPARTGLHSMTGPLSPLADVALEQMGVDTSKNLTDQAVDKAGETYTDVKQGVGEKYDEVKEEVGETYNDVKEGASETYQNAKEEVSDTYHDVSDAASKGWGATTKFLGF
jgi:hypothetical protein